MSLRKVIYPSPRWDARHFSWMALQTSIYIHEKIAESFEENVETRHCKIGEVRFRDCVRQEDKYIYA